jgi:hypothetical protein
LQTSFWRLLIAALPLTLLAVVAGGERRNGAGRYCCSA